MPEYKTYDPKKVSVVVGGVPLSGFADGSMIKAAFAVDRHSTHVGTDGQGRHIESANRSGTITVSMADYSPGNDILDVIVEANVPVPIIMTDKTSLKRILFASSCKIVKIPDMDVGKEASENEWTFQFIDGQIRHSGALPVT